MNGFKHVSINIDDQKTATVTLDSADRPLNVFDEELLTEMQTVVTQLGAQSDLKLIVFGSGKQSGFLAGADVPHIQSIQSEAVAREALVRGQMLFNAIAALNAPTVAVIHGVCLGGGLEFAMSCRYRIALDIASTKLGLPETQLGLIPGWGGTQRLPAIVGLKQAVTMILQGTQLSATEAFKAGLVDALATVENTEADVNDFLEKCRSTSPPRRRRPKASTWR